ncbi:MAG: ferritin-like domain-containing protein, partial [Bacillota bacterium]
MNKALSLKLLKTALADELLATYQYLVCVYSSNTKEDRSEADDEFEQHYKEEFVHADKIMKRIKELGGKVIPDPKDLEKYAN